MLHDKIVALQIALRDIQEEYCKCLLPRVKLNNIVLHGDGVSLSTQSRLVEY